MQVIGLTGGIGAGKSTVSAYLRNRGYRILDADQMARAMTEKGSPVLEELAHAFGGDILLEDGTLDRRMLAERAFRNADTKARLENLTTRAVVNRVAEELTRLRETGAPGLVFVDAPLLFETGADRLTDCVWLVDADREVRIRRVAERDGLTREEIVRRMDHQMSDQEKRRRAQECLDNSGGTEALYRQIEQLLERYDQERETQGKSISQNF